MKFLDKIKDLFSDEEEVIEITKNVLLLYKNKFNKFIDEIIEFTGHQKILK